MPAKFTGTIDLGSGAVADRNVSNTSGDEIGVTKTIHLIKPGTNWDLAIGATPATREEIIYVCEATTATLRSAHFLLNDTGTTTDCDMDVLKNGTTMLSAAINITHSDADRAVKDGTLSVTSIAAGDVISVSLAVTSSTGAQGPYGWLQISEGA